MRPRAFRIAVPEEVLADLRRRLGHTRWPDEVPGGGWRYGTDLGYLQRLCRYWQERYDWRVHEAQLNGFRQFTVALGGIELHFIHEPGVGPRPRPLLLSHGWPGSVWEFYKLIPLLTDPARYGGDPADAFTVVAPSLPGYAFSFRPGQPRFGTTAIAELFAALMTEVLGYRRFGAHGGDWGALITARLGHAFADRLVGIHVTNAFLRPAGRPASAEEQVYLEQARQWMREDGGYMAIQSTRPQTLAYGLTDSPAGLAAWIVEKFRAWSDCDGDVERRFTADELLTNVMLYWVTGAVNASFWPYHAHAHQPWRPGPQAPVRVPTGYADFPREIVRPPRSLVEQSFDLRRWTPMRAGGHFAALEEPVALAADLTAFFRDRWEAGTG